MKYIKIFEDFNNHTGLKDLILAISESPVHIKTLSGFQIWQCENLDEAGLNDLKERLSYLDLEAFDCGKYYESGTEIGHRYIEVVLDVGSWIIVVDVVLKHEIRFSRLYS